VAGHADHRATGCRAAHVTITGTGPGTVIDLSGDQQQAAVSVFSLDPGASDITLERMTIDTSGATIYLHRPCPGRVRDPPGCHLRADQPGDDHRRTPLLAP
jgi:hypothetical protein